VGRWRKPVEKVLGGVCVHSQGPKDSFVRSL
jgi:hypothetical protein